jgi:hypothetical protein
VHQQAALHVVVAVIPLLVVERSEDGNKKGNQQMPMVFADFFLSVTLPHAG